ncbi:hypothetical protein ABIF96_005934 [Bradyrhizobium ottawaense]|uniref:hypothetical protein n=1 Tax=Bradyrhizobium ottawaense TaxID=931866 RepID=UPI003833CC29
MKSILIAALFVACSFEVCAQEVCVGILDKIGRDFSYEAREDAKSKNIFDEYCDGSSEKKGKTTTVGLDAVVKAIPVKINVGTGSNEEKLQNFCKTYNESVSQTSSELINKSTVVREAFSAFNHCIELTKSAIAFSPVIGTQLVAVGIRRTDATDVEFMGVTFDPKVLDCRGPAGPNGSSVKLDGKTRKKLSDQTFPVICERLPVTTAGGGKSYPRTEIAFAMSRGTPLLIPIPDEEILPTKTVSEMQSQLDALKGSIAAVGSRNPYLDCRTTEGDVLTMRNPEAYARIPEQFLKKGYVLVGGGCRQTTNQNMFAHSMAVGNDWKCKVSDFPGSEIPSGTQAFVTYCKVSQ